MRVCLSQLRGCVTQWENIVKTEISKTFAVLRQANSIFDVVTDCIENNAALQTGTACFLE